jgi:hypothetical protein
MLESTKSKSGYITLNETEQFEQEAKIAVDMVMRWGMVASTCDGEDSSGRAKLELLTPAELVDRAVKTSKLLMNALRANGLIYKTPSIVDESEEA